MIAVLCGGVGAARLLSGMVEVMPATEITAVVNIGDDTVLHGLHISPDLDTVTYTLAGAVDAGTGWGLRDESWAAMDALERYGGETWFRLGDRDLATHLYRTHRMAQGADLATVTAEIATAWGVSVVLLPASNDPVRTMVTVAEPDGSSREIEFQDYFVRHRHSIPVRGVRFAGAPEAQPAPGVLERLRAADAIVIAPSNPVVSIGPILAVDAIADVVRERRDRTVGISPIIAGEALKGPAARLLTELGHESSAAGVARFYADVAGTLLVDTADASLATEVEAAGVRCVITPTVMRSDADAAALSRVVLGSAGG